MLGGIGKDFERFRVSFFLEILKSQARSAPGCLFHTTVKIA